MRYGHYAYCTHMMYVCMHVDILFKFNNTCLHVATCEANRTYAYSSACIVDISQNYKPIAGYINICPQVKLAIIAITYILYVCI